MIGLALCLMLGATPAVPGELSAFHRVVGTHLSRGAVPAQVGHWATFRMGGAGRTQYLRIAVVGEEKDARGRDAFWVELDVGTHPSLKAPLLQTKLLMAKKLFWSPDGVTRVYLAVGHERPKEVRVDQVFPPEPPQARAEGPVATTSREGRAQKVMTAAGSLDAVPVELLVRNEVIQRVWVSREVPLFHIAKLELPPIDHAFEVHAYGTDARPQMRVPLTDGSRPELGQDQP